MITTAQALVSLRPDVEWTMHGDDIENIIWHTENVKPLTQTEVDAEMIKLQAASAAQETVNAAARAAALVHARSVGFTDEMITVMYPGISEV